MTVNTIKDDANVVNDESISNTIQWYVYNDVGAIGAVHLVDVVFECK
jgi:hypothetical protein